MHPTLEKELLNELGDQPYSIFLDESTDVRNVKHMAYCIRYFNQQLEKIVVNFIDFQPVFRAAATDLCDTIPVSQF